MLGCVKCPKMEDEENTHNNIDDINPRTGGPLSDAWKHRQDSRYEKAREGGDRKEKQKSIS